MTVKLLSQIDIIHWTVLFLDDKWKDKTGDFRFDAGKYEAGDKVSVSVQLFPKMKEPTTVKYCGILQITGKAKK